MKRIQKFLNNIPALLSSTTSIFIFVFLFIYLFVFGIIGLFIGQIKPSSDMQLVLGNYTNVLSALGAALAAGAGAKHTKNLRDLHDRHQKMQESINDLHTKIDELNKIR